MPPKHPGSAELVETLAAYKATETEQINTLVADHNKTELARIIVAGRINHRKRDIADAEAAAKIEALEGALEPSAETKAAYIGEFSFDINDWSDDGEERPRRVVSVPWTTIKEIMAAIKARAALGGGRG